MNDRTMMRVSNPPPFPNGGELYLAYDGEFKFTAYFHIDPTNGEHWWESVDGESLTDITHWDYLPDKFE